jgi:hypothetical protein
MNSHRKRLAFLVVGVLPLAACKSAERVCAPTDPLCAGVGSGAIASVTVTSEIDTVMAVGRTAQLSAVARNANSQDVNTSFTWTSNHTSAATVNATSGLVTALAADTFRIRAAPNTGSVVGELKMRAVAADLPAVQTIMGDALVTSIRNALSATPQAALSTLMGQCATHRVSGNLLALDTCLANIIALTGAGATDNQLLAVLDMFALEARRRLRL